MSSGDRNDDDNDVVDNRNDNGDVDDGSMSRLAIADASNHYGGKGDGCDGVGGGCVSADAGCSVSVSTEERKEVVLGSASSASSLMLQQQQQQQQRPQRTDQMVGDGRGWRPGTEQQQQQKQQKLLQQQQQQLQQQQQQLQQLQQGETEDVDSPFLLDPSSLQLQNNLQFRFLLPDDIDELKRLCKDCFPVEYPEEWYQDITKDDGRFFSLASTLQGKIVGFIVAEIKTRLRCNKEDQDILSPSYPLSTPIAYILSLGVSCPFRCQGVGSLLLDNLLNHLTSKDHHTCKAVFLHVLCSNSRAIRFYEKRLFSKHSFLPLYYSIQGKLKDGFSYVLYLNGGRPPWSFRSSLRSSATALASLRPCALSSRLFLRVNRLLWCFVAAIFVGIKKTATISFAHGYHRT